MWGGQLNRRLDIQGLRALAVIAVVVFHAGVPLESGFLGVDIFFAISGFVITGVLIRSAGPGFLLLKNFYVRRFRRLVPALSILIFVTLVLSLLFFSPFEAQKNTAQTAVGASFGLANAVISLTTGGYFDLAATTNPLLHTWSLAVEEQFYLIFPSLFIAAIWAAKRIRRNISGAMLVTVSITLLSLILMFHGNSSFQNHIPSILKGFYSPFPRMWEFGIGGIAFLLSQQLKNLSPKALNFLAVLGSIFLVVAFFVTDETTPTPGAPTIIPIVGVSLIMFSGSFSHAPVISNALSQRPFVFIGDISYSLYLWHWPLIVFASAIWPDFPLAMFFAAIVAFIPAILSYFFIEQRLIKPWPFKKSRATLLAVSLIMVPVLSASALLYANKNNFWLTTIADIKFQMSQPHLAEKNGCVTLDIPENPIDPKCAFGMSASDESPIYLVGDSHADQFSEALDEVALARSSPLIVSTTNGCPFIPLFIHRPELGDEWQSKCHANALGKLKWLENQTPGTVVISNSGLYFTSMDISLTSESPVEPQSSNLKLYSEALTAEIIKLKDAGHDVVVLSPTPQYLQQPLWPQNCTIPSLLVSWCSSTIPLERAFETIKPVAQVTEKVAQETGAQYIDVTSKLCPAEMCTTVSSKVVHFRNPDHITVNNSKDLAKFFVKSLAVSP